MTELAGGDLGPLATDRRGICMAQGLTGSLASVK